MAKGTRKILNPSLIWVYSTISSSLCPRLGSVLLTWIDEREGNVKSLPQVPGKAVPNSAQDWLMPNHLNLPLLGVADVLEAGGEEVVDVTRVVAAPGTHWLYQSLT
jgi:hypothetical protein